MASSHLHVFPGQPLPPRYEQLREEQEMRPAACTVVQVQQQQQQQQQQQPQPQPQHVFLQPPSDHFVWSLLTTIYCNVCCLGLFALIYSVKARDRKVLGDLSGAVSAGSNAKWLNIIALVLILLMTILVIILAASGVIAVSQHGR